MNFKELENIIKKNHWRLIRIIGSNHQYRKIGYPNFIIVPNYGDVPLPIDVVKNLEKTTGLSLLR